MPTVIWEDGYRFFFYSNEGNEPRHIHVEKGEGAGKYWLDPVSLCYAHGFSRAQLARIRELVWKNADLFRRKWDNYFGH